MIFINEILPSLYPFIYTDKKLQLVYIERIIVRKECMIKKRRKNNVLLLQKVLLTK
jgi:hypothetical protein